MANVCKKCKCEIQLPDLVACPNCKETYHSWCWKKTESCISCEQSANEEPIEAKDIPDAVIQLSSENEGMFANIGGKLKGLATAVTVIGVIAGIIVFISNIAIDGDSFFSGLLSGLAIALLSWIGSFALYGFGALISSSQNTERLLREMLKEIKK